MRSLLPKIDELRLTCTVNKLDVIYVVETTQTRLGDGISDSKVSITDYCIIRFDRNRHGGGIAFYIKSYLHSEVLLSCPYGLEFALFSVVNPCVSYKVHIGLFLPPPKLITTCFGSCLQAVNVHTFSNFVLLGDFNINVNNPSHPLYSNLCNILNSFSLVQVISEPTYVSPAGSASIIDLALISDLSSLSSCSILPPLIIMECSYL